MKYDQIVGFIDWTHFVLLIACALCAEWMSTYFMTVLSQFYEAVVSNNEKLFFHQVQFACLLSLCIAGLKSLKKFSAQRFSLHWRMSTVNCLHSHYFGTNGRAMNEVIGLLDNVDQRITQDIDNLSSLYAELIEKVVVVPFIIVYYSTYLVVRFGWSVVVFAFVYFFVGAIVGLVLTNCLVPVVYVQEMLEGNFRFFHNGIRSNHGVVVLLKGLHNEMNRASTLFDRVITNKKKFIGMAVWVDLFSSWFDYTGSIVNYAIVGCVIFYSLSFSSDSQRLSAFTSGSYALLYLINAFSTIFDTAKIVGVARGLHKRLSELQCTLSAASNENGNFPRSLGDGSSYSRLPSDERVRHIGGGNPTFTTNDTAGLSLVALQSNLSKSISSTAPLITLRGVSLRSLDGSRVLLKNLSLDLHRGMRLLVTGPSGCGKSTFLNSLNLMLQRSSGDDDGFAGDARLDGYCRFDVLSDQFAVCTQTPFCILGSLLENVIYPDSVPRISSGSASRISDFPSSSLSIPLNSLEAEEILRSETVEERLLQCQREVKHLLGLVGLQSFAAEVEKEIERNWTDTISEGEKQRLCVARLLYQKPVMCFLDEATSAVDEETESSLYELITSRCDTFISIGHRSTLRKFHTHELKIDAISQVCSLESL